MILAEERGEHHLNQSSDVGVGIGTGPARLHCQVCEDPAAACPGAQASKRLLSAGLPGPLLLIPGDAVHPVGRLRTSAARRGLDPAASSPASTANTTPHPRGCPVRAMRCQSALPVRSASWPQLPATTGCGNLPDGSACCPGRRPPTHCLGRWPCAPSPLGGRGCPRLLGQADDQGVVRRGGRWGCCPGRASSSAK